MFPKKWMRSSRSRRHCVVILSALLLGLNFHMLFQLSTTTTLYPADIPDEPVLMTSSRSLELATNISRRTYHSWDAKGASLKPILERLNCTWSDECIENPLVDSAVGRNVAWACQPFPVFVAITNDPKHQHQPVLLLSTKIQKKIQKCVMTRWRVVWPHFMTALRVQLPQHLDRFPSLVSALKKFPLIPFYVEYADYTGCPDPSSARGQAYDKIKRIIGMPYMSICKSNLCPHGFPIPTYMDYNVAQLPQQQEQEGKYDEGSGGWESLMQQWNHTYPWHKKIPKATWRGGIKNFRGQVLEQTKKLPLFFDAEAVGRNNRQTVEATMGYKLVLDMDGNSWSERFPRLLCYNSAVVLVVAPEGIDDYEEYILQDLVPNVHFIPASVENITAVVANLLDGNNEDFLQSVVREANAFCRARIIPHELNLDFLSVLDGYVETLDKYDMDWKWKWKNVHESYVGADLGHDGFLAYGSGYWANSISNPPNWNLTESISNR